MSEMTRFGADLIQALSEALADAQGENVPGMKLHDVPLTLSTQDLEAFVDRAELEMTPMPRAALFLAGKVFTQYRRLAGSRSGVLPDFFIGAHAAVAQLKLITRDVKHYRTYFPSLQLIAPDM